MGLGIIGPDVIDEINILRATHLAMKTALDDLGVVFDYILVDGIPVPDLPKAFRAIVKGDSLSVSIGAASIIAKVTQGLDYGRDGPALSRVWLRGAQGLFLQVAHRGHRPPRSVPVPQEVVFAHCREDCQLQTPRARLGRSAEIAAAAELGRRGYRIIASNYRCRRGESTSSPATMIRWCSSKSAANFDAYGTPAESVSPAKQRKLIATARNYLAEKNLWDTACRFDVVEVVQVDGKLVVSDVIRDAFSA